MDEEIKNNLKPEALLSVLLAVSLLMLIFTGSNGISKILLPGSKILFGIQKLSGTLTDRIKDGFASIKRLQDMRIKYEKALAKLNDFQGLERSLLELKRENMQLKKQLDYSLDLPFKNIPVRIIARDPANLFDSITIDKGSSENIKINMIVISFQNNFLGLLGKVVSVNPHSALVRPIIDPENYVAARLQRSPLIQGLIKGRGKGQPDRLVNAGILVKGPQRPVYKIKPI